MRPEGAVPVSAHDVAREVRKRMHGVGVVVLHKLLYYCQGWHIAHTGRPLFSEHLEAWANGPVVASLWRDEVHQNQPPPEQRSLAPDALATVGYVVSRYGNLTAQQLIALTHDEDPWRAVSRSDDETGDQRITLDSLRRFFEGQSEEARRLAEHAVTHPKMLSLISEAMLRRQEPGTPDDPAVIKARLEALG